MGEFATASRSSLGTGGLSPVSWVLPLADVAVELLPLLSDVAAKTPTVMPMMAKTEKTISRMALLLCRTLVAL